jgi:N-methylhydantoinase B
MSLDPIQLESLYHKFKATTEEMGIALGRTARSSYVRETHDFATALCAPSGRFFAYPAETGISLCIDQDCSALIRAMSDLKPGDVLVTNHPYLAPGLGSHLPDINLLKPYFHEGQIVCYGWSFAHCADIGGGVPSSISPSFDSLFQEGLAIPPMKLVEEGTTSPALMALLRANSRVPDIILGDLQAQLSALHVGERRVAELIAAHGIETFIAARDGLVTYAKSRARDVQRQIPDGVYEFSDYLDDDYRSKIPVRFRCRMEVNDGRIHLDLTGTDPQLAAPYNVPTGGVRHPYLTSKLMHLLMSCDHGLPLNSGLFENITVHVPRGTIMNPEMPAPVGIRHAGAIRFNDAILGCLAQANAKLAPAASGGTVIPVVVSQIDPGSGTQRVSVVQSIAGGGGATMRSDGTDGRDRSLANISNTPTERGELELDVRVERYGLMPDSGGPGRFRGGAGVIYSLRILGSGVELMGRGLERFVFQPWGLNGGRPGMPARVVLNMGTSEAHEIGKFDRIRAQDGDILTIITPGGGGHGHPYERDPEAVARDIRRGLVTIDGARRDYGVIVSPMTFVVDHEATKSTRRNRPEFDDGGLGRTRAAWEGIFDDAAMTRFSTMLLEMPPSVRHEIRRMAFERVVPGVASKGLQALFADGFDAAQARQRFNETIEELVATWLLR